MVSEDAFIRALILPRQRNQSSREFPCRVARVFGPSGREACRAGPQAGRRTTISIFVLNPDPKTTEGAIPFMLDSLWICVDPRRSSWSSWHTEPSSTARLTWWRRRFSFRGNQSGSTTARAFGQDGNTGENPGGPALPRSPRPVMKASRFFRQKAWMPSFLSDDAGTFGGGDRRNRNYQNLTCLQIILDSQEIYEFIRSRKLELFKNGGLKRNVESQDVRACIRYGFELSTSFNALVLVI